jgi:hypothetical protein
MLNLNRRCDTRQAGNGRLQAAHLSGPRSDPDAASSGTKLKAPGSAGRYLLGEGACRQDDQNTRLYGSHSLFLPLFNRSRQRSLQCCIITQQPGGPRTRPDTRKSPCTRVATPSPPLTNRAHIIPIAEPATPPSTCPSPWFRPWRFSDAGRGVRVETLVAESGSGPRGVRRGHTAGLCWCIRFRDQAPARWSRRRTAWSTSSSVQDAAHPLAGAPSRRSAPFACVITQARGLPRRVDRISLRSAT